MSLKTKYYELFKPELSDPADITKMNPNWDTVDEKLKEAEDRLAELGDGGAKLLVKTAIIRTDTWSEDEETGVKYQTVIITDITSDMTAKVDTLNTHERTTEGYTLYVEEQNQYLDFITNGDAETVDGGIKFYIYGEPNTVDIPIVVEVS
jgi:hypothetical protein